MTKPQRLLKVHSPEEAATFAVAIIENAGEDKKEITVGLPGGRSILPVLEALKNKTELLDKISFILVDERRTGDKNADVLKKSISNLSTPQITEDVEKDLKHYTSLLKPFDVIILGVGEDGHVASLFPGNPALDSENLVEHITNSPKEPSERMTITFKAMSENATIILLFLGKDKKNALRFFIEEDDYQLSPASYFKKYESLYVITDQNTGN